MNHWSRSNCNSRAINAANSWSSAKSSRQSKLRSNSAVNDAMRGTARFNIPPRCRNIKLMAPASSLPLCRTLAKPPIDWICRILAAIQKPLANRNCVKVAKRAATARTYPFVSTSVDQTFGAHPVKHIITNLSGNRQTHDVLEVFNGFAGL